MEDFKKFFEGITSDNFQEKLLDIQENFKTCVDENESLRKQIDTQNETIGNLRDTNQRLFLRVSAGTSEAPEETTHQITYDEILKNI